MGVRVHRDRWLTVRVTVEMPSIRKAMDGATRDVASMLTGAMREATLGLEQGLRGQVLEAGMGRRLAQTWKGEAYPQGRVSLSPAGYVYSRAPQIIDAFDRGATIRPVNGAQYLWIPTKNVPRMRSRRRMDANEVENHFNAEFIVLRGRNGTLLAYMDLIEALNVKRRSGWRRDTAGRRKKGRRTEPVLMFVLRRSVKLRKLFDLQGQADHAAARFVDLVSSRWK